MSVLPALEVKPSTEKKPVNLLDLAFQCFVYSGAVLKFGAFVNSAYVP